MATGPPESARLTFRRHRPEDEEVVARLWMDAAVTRFITGAPLTRGMIAPRMNWHAGHWSRFGFGYWVVEERVTGRFVGEVGFLDIDRGIEPPIERAPELGWVISPAAQGMGHATEAALAALAWGEAAFGWRRHLPDRSRQRRIDPGGCESGLSRGGARCLRQGTDAHLRTPRREWCLIGSFSVARVAVKND